MTSIRSNSDSTLKSESSGESIQFEQEESPWDRANCFSRYFLYFMLPTFKRGNRHQLTLDNEIKVPQADQARNLEALLRRRYEEQIITGGSREPSFVRCLFRAYGRQLLFVFLINFLVEIVGPIMQTIALGWIVRDSGAYYRLQANISSDLTSFASSRTQQEEAMTEAYRLVVYDSLILVAAIAVSAIFQCPADLRSNRVGLQIRAAASRMIYKKSLKLNQAALQETTVGQMVNLLSNDVNRFEEVAKYLSYILLGPLQSLIILIILATFYLGPWPTLAILAVLLFYVSLQSLMSYGFGKARSKTAQLTDERVRLVNELVKSIQLIKMYAWELPFKRLLEAARGREMVAISKTSRLRTINLSLFHISWMLILFAALETYVMLGNQLDPEIVFITLGFAQTMGVLFALFFPWAVAYAAEAYISCRRINRFLLLPEQERQPANFRRTDDGSCYSYALTFTEVTCSWLREQEAPIIRGLSFKIHPRDLVLVVGRVGSGKSSLLMAILGELPVTSGSLEVSGRISYASQDPWIFSGSVRDNILFGREFDSKRYKEVLRVCSLERDLEILIEGDSTIVGERGVSLSGGQKARVNLARALYTEADIYLLDDPLAAVDAPVARHIFNECLRTFLKKKTVVLATHQLQFLKYATKVLVVDRDSPAAFGSLQEVMDSEAFKVIGYSKETFEGAGEERDSDRSSTSGSSRSSERDKKLQTSLVVEWESGEKQPEESTRKQAGEKLQAISVNWSTYLFYLTNAFTLFGFIWFVVFALGSSLMRDVNNFFVTLWADSRQPVGPGNAMIRGFLSQLSFAQISTIYSTVVALSLLLAFLKTGIFFWSALRASRRLHNKLLQSVIYAPMKFFNFTPAGVLLNRFSRDLGAVDENLPAVLLEFINVFSRVTQTVIITTLLQRINLFGFTLLIPSTYLLRRFCSPTTRKLKQIESIKRSPILSLVATTASGLPTVRAFKAQKVLMRRFDRHQDDHSGAWFGYICASRWFLLHMDWLKLIYIILLVGLLIYSLDSLSPSILGLLLTLMSGLPRPLQFVMTKVIDLEAQMTSVQRIREFCSLEPEEWPHRLFYQQQVDEEPFMVTSGEIKFTDVRLSYFPDEQPVLKGISFAIKAGEKVGVVGRTGAGKSSIVSVLFRLYDFEGLVEIDGVDIKRLPLEQLRRSLSIIPQDPILFNGTIRKNLDPFDEYQEEELWAALEAVQLKSLISQYSQQLEFMINEGGANFSVGQRQLICLARATLRRNKILILDEATANVDPETDGLIQATIARQFAHCTVITIAHRLITIADADRVLVLEQGEVKEFAKPLELIGDETSLFSQMVASLSTQQAAKMRSIIERR